MEGHLHEDCQRCHEDLKEGGKTYEDTSTALRGGALATKTLDLAIRLDLVVLEDGHLHFLALVLDLLGGLYTR